MTTNTQAGASRAVFYASASALPMLRGPTISYAPDGDEGGGGEPAPDTAAPAAAEGGEQPEAQAAPDADDGLDDDLGDDDPAAAAEGEGQPKPKKTARERIAELTFKAKEAERQRDEALQREQSVLDRLTTKEKPAAEDVATVASAEDAKPDPNDYEFGVTDERYVEDLADWKVDQRFKERDADEKGRTEFQKTLTAFSGRVTELFPDGEPEGLKAYKALPDVGSMVMQQMVLDSDVGPKLADHLGTNPAEIKRISGLHPLLQAREIGKLEAKFAVSAAPAPVPVKTVSDAPAPPTGQARGGGGKFTVAPDTEDFAAFEKTYGN